MTSIAAPTNSSLQRNTALFLTFAMAAVVGAALGFEHIGHYIPCKLCLGQRVPYYIGVPVMALAAVSATLRWPQFVTRGLLLAGGLLMAWGLFLSVQHSGVEWGWWAGPTD
jgi:disulfide bond formation protein DsbB